jgi:hypothetical protein
MVGRLIPLWPGLTAWPRRAGVLGLVVVVSIVHGCVADVVADQFAELNAAAAMPKRFEVMFVREMEPAAPAALAPAPARAEPARRSARERVVAAEPAASAVQPEPVPVVVPPSEPASAVADLSPPVAVEPAKPETADVAMGVAAPAATASGPTPFAWPVSTRLTYLLNGNYHGEVHGTAQVEWVRVGLRYQVHLDVRVGLPFAPLLSRRMTSEGRLTPEGLMPERYDEESKVAFRDRRRATLKFDPDAVVMPNGLRRERWPGIQDAASQFVQLAYLFTTQPELLTPGRTIEVPLALPRSIDRWTYDVLPAETLYTPFGHVDAIHLKPRSLLRGNSDLPIEIWFAPTLAYLPVRIRIQQDAETFIDLMIERKPQLAVE